MKKIKIFLVVVVAFFGYWFISSAIELHGLMKKYPNEFKQQGDFSFYKFYNTYRTLSYGDIMVKRGHVHHDICFEVGFDSESEKNRLVPLIKESYRLNTQSDLSEYVDNVDRFITASPSCLKEAKLINFEFNCKETYATYACDVDGYVNEFTYTGNRNEKCNVIRYKKSWGIEPK